MPSKIRPYTDVHELLAKLGSKATLWERAARDAQERAAEFERAAHEVRNGATSVTIGRTTYTLTAEGA